MAALAVTVCATPVGTSVPSIEISKSATVSEPPSSLVRVFASVSVGAISSLTISHTTAEPSDRLKVVAVAGPAAGKPVVWLLSSLQDHVPTV